MLANTYVQMTDKIVPLALDEYSFTLEWSIYTKMYFPFMKVVVQLCMELLLSLITCKNYYYCPEGLRVISVNASFAQL